MRASILLLTGRGAAAAPLVAALSLAGCADLLTTGFGGSERRGLTENIHATIEPGETHAYHIVVDTDVLFAAFLDTGGNDPDGIRMDVRNGANSLVATVQGRANQRADGSGRLEFFSGDRIRLRIESTSYSGPYSVDLFELNDDPEVASDTLTFDTFWRESIEPPGDRDLFVLPATSALTIALYIERSDSMPALIDVTYLGPELEQVGPSYAIGPRGVVQVPKFVGSSVGPRFVLVRGRDETIMQADYVLRADVVSVDPEWVTSFEVGQIYDEPVNADGDQDLFTVDSPGLLVHYVDLTDLGQARVNLLSPGWISLLDQDSSASILWTRGVGRVRQTGAVGFLVRAIDGTGEGFYRIRVETAGFPVDPEATLIFGDTIDTFLDGPLDTDYFEVPDTSAAWVVSVFAADTAGGDTLWFDVTAGQVPSRHEPTGAAGGTWANTARWQPGAGVRRVVWFNTFRRSWYRGAYRVTAEIVP